MATLAALSTFPSFAILALSTAIAGIFFVTLAHLGLGGFPHPPSDGF